MLTIHEIGEVPSVGFVQTAAHTSNNPLQSSGNAGGASVRETFPGDMQGGGTVYQHVVDVASQMPGDEKAGHRIEPSRVHQCGQIRFPCLLGCACDHDGLGGKTADLVVHFGDEGFKPFHYLEFIE